MDLYIYVNTDKYFYICTFTCHICIYKKKSDRVTMFVCV